MTPNDLKKIIEWLGVEGARAGLKLSKLTDKDLLAITFKLKLRQDFSESRDTTIEKIVHHFEVKEIKRVDDLLKMEYNELINYFNDVNASNEDLLKVMKELNFKVGAEERKHLRNFVARQISETALFSKVARNDELKTDE